MLIVFHFYIGLYPGSEAAAAFEEELKEHQTDKGTIRIPYGRVDPGLIEKIARWCLETGNHA